MISDEVEIQLSYVLEESLQEETEKAMILEQLFLGLVYDIIFKDIVPETEVDMENEIFEQLDNEAEDLGNLMINY